MIENYCEINSRSFAAISAPFFSNLILVILLVIALSSFSINDLSRYVNSTSLSSHHLIHTLISSNTSLILNPSASVHVSHPIDLLSTPWFGCSLANSKSAIFHSVIYACFFNNSFSSFASYFYLFNRSDVSFSAFWFSEILNNIYASMSLSSSSLYYNPYGLIIEIDWLKFRPSASFSISFINELDELTRDRKSCRTLCSFSEDGFLSSKDAIHFFSAFRSSSLEFSFCTNFAESLRIYSNSQSVCLNFLMKSFME